MEARMERFTPRNPQDPPVVASSESALPHSHGFAQRGGDEVASSTSIDRLTHAFMGRLTSSVSPVSLVLAYFDWAAHLAEAPGKRALLAEDAVRKAMRLGMYAWQVMAGLPAEPCVRPLPHDRRFTHPGWQRWPFNIQHQAFLLEQQWWHGATTGVGGVSRHHEHLVAFVTRQLLDMVSPVNFIPTNPEVLDATLRE